ncbi:staphyloferrin B biosynthesis decarboxylase SbnH [Paractinoplanes abujensis]|uniref:Diaminopimelate decarboxylase n=1 Tax=Paractinoplanes abujensis TaxID=882441 RepID=A0A7W7CNE9_9ACTN|nr:alanine racemase [Actinoplanes abujensis]MBB4691757.1 diaminopimelate decarboxylase [Actinoplanes abujensis]GID16820.1 staphyloferrin B biosynthesis decarboxylase SbnH [Actinoplanes abujensis]
MHPPDHVVQALRTLERPVCAYVYDTAALRSRATTVRRHLPAKASLLYAVKANGHPSVLTTLAAECDGLEVASGGELDRARQAGARRIVFGGPAKTDAELTAALDAGAQINAESIHELHRIAALRPGAEVVLRVNRAGPALTGSHTMTGTPTPFGVDETQLGQALAVPGVQIIGFHLHAVSNNLDGHAHAAFVRSALDWALATGIHPRVVNVGGGFGVDYLSDTHIDLTPLRGIDVPPGVDLVFEPGRLLAADAGWYATEVIDVKTTHGRTFAVLRGGTHHFRLPAAWGYSHPFTVIDVDDWPHPYARPVHTDGEIDAVGELCTPRDVLSRGRHVTRVRAGDLLVFGRTGAYGWDISHHDFLRHPPPEFVIL